MNEGSGTRFYNLANKKEFNFTSGCNWSGGGINFNGSSDYATDSVNLGLDLSPQMSKVISFRQTNSLSDRVLVDQEFGNNINSGFACLTGDHFTRVEFNTAGESDLFYGATDLVNRYQLAWTYDESELRAYRNGKFITSNSVVGDLIEHDHVSVIGRRHTTPGYYFNGFIYYYYIYNRGLTSSEIAWLYRDPYAMFEQPSSVWYGFEEEAGGLEKALSDSITLADTAIRSFGANRADGITLADVRSHVAAFIRTIPDSITLTDVIGKVVGVTKADGIILTDTRVKTIGIARADTITLADLLSNITSYSRTLSDIITLTDLQSHGGDLTKDLSDSITLDDVRSHVASFIRTIPDGVTLADTRNGAVSYIRTLSDQVTLADVLGNAIYVSKADSITLADTVVKAIYLARADTITLADLTGLPDPIITWTDVIIEGTDTETGKSVRVVGRYRET